MTDTSSSLSILMIEDDPVHARLAQAALLPAPEGSDWRLTLVATLAAGCAVTDTPDLILLDLNLPDSSGLDTLRRLRERFSFVPVVLLTAIEDPEVEASALRAGAQDFLGKDELTPRTLRRVVRYAVERHGAELDLLRLSTRDELTGLLNRRGFFMSAKPMATMAERAGRSFVVLFADMDGLKGINDTHGHHAGDEAIRDAAYILGQSFRSADVVARIGGDEFAVLAPEAGPETLEIMLRRLRSWQDERNRYAERPFLVTLSVGGVAWTASQPKTLEALLAEADAAAYKVKRR